MARFTQDRMYEMLGDISKKQKPIYKAGGLKEADCPFGYSLVNGKCVPDPDCEDGQCRETDEIQAIYDKADSIPNRVVDFERGIVDEVWTDPATGQYRDYIVMGKPGQDAREVWKKHGVKNFVEPSCMYVAGLGYRCAPESEEYLKKFNPVHFNSNIGFIHAVDRGDVPFKRIDKFSDRNFDALEKGNVQVGDIVNFKGADNSHAMTFVGYSEDGHPKYFDSNGSSRHVGIHGAWPDLRPNNKGIGKDYAYVNRFDTERYVDDTYGKQVADLEKQARENPTYYKQGGLTKYAEGGVNCEPGYYYDGTECVKIPEGANPSIKKPVIYVDDENDPRYKDYLIKQALYNYSNNPSFNQKDRAYYDLLNAIEKGQDNPEKWKKFSNDYYQSLLSKRDKDYQEYPEDFNDEDSKVTYAGLRDPNVGFYGSKVEYSKLPSDKLKTDEHYNNQYFHFKNLVDDPFFQKYQPSGWEKKLYYTSNPFDDTYGRTGNPKRGSSNYWTTPNTVFVEDEINRDALRKIYPNVPDSFIDEHIADTRKEPSYISNKFTDGYYEGLNSYDDDSNYIADKTKETFIDRDNLKGYLQDSVVDDITRHANYIPTWSEPEEIYQVKEALQKLEIKRPPLLETSTPELQGEYQEKPAPEYHMPTYNVERPGIYMRSHHSGQLIPHARPTLTTVTKPGMISKAVQKMTEYDPKYFEGYTDDEGEYISGELEKAQEEGRRVNFQGANSLQDIKAQKEYNEAYDEYEAKQQFAKAMAAGLSLKKHGGLHKFVKGVDSCEEGYVKDANGNCITQKQYNEQLAQQQLDNAKDFTSKYFESPMYNQMLQKSAGDKYENIKESREENLEDVSDVRYKDKQFRNGLVGYSDASDGTITLGQDALVNKGVAVHELSHSTDAPVNFFDKLFSAKTKRLIPESDKELIEGMVNKEFHKTPYFQENRNRIMDFGPEGFHEEKKAYDDYYKDYVGQPTETRARLMEIRKAASDAYQKDPNAMYDPFNQEVTPETYQKLLKHDYEPAKDENRKWEKKFATPLEELKGIYTDEEIMKLLNTVAENQSVNDRDPNMQTANTGGQMSKYAPGGVTADPPDWLTKRGANVYFNPAYQNNFTGSVNTNQSYFNNLPVFKQDPAAVFGIEGSLSKNRNAKKEAGRGWLYNAYVGMPYSQVIGDNAQYKPSAGIKFDYENAPQDKKFRPHIEAALDYNMHTGPLASVSGGARYPITPWGNKLVKPGYGVGHIDLYGGFSGGAGAEGAGAGLNYGARIQGKYQPKWLDRLSRGSYLYGEAGIQFDPVKGKMVQKQTDQEWTGGQDQGSGEFQQMVTQEKDPGVKWGSTVYANVGIKKDVDDIKFKNNDISKRIRDVEEKEKQVEYENYKQEEPEEEPKKEKSKKECPEGERRHCENCPCEPIEKAKHPRWLREGGMITNEKVTLLNKFFRQ